MTAVSLFDVLARDTGTSGNAARLGQKLIESSLGDWERVLDYERHFGAAASPALEAEISRSIYAMYEKWAGEAEEVLKRTRQLAPGALPAENLEQLEDAFGRVQARLKLTPEKLARATEQVRRGETVPLKELQDELRTRLRT